ncbi:MAG: ferredoxin [Candidatus Zixiibacteriota bacterium]
MLANYGYTDGSGEYYIAIDTDKCIECGDHPCTNACPQKLFEIIEDDYDDMVASIVESGRKRIKELCANCKPVSDRPELPCVCACPKRAISHTW